MLTVPDELRFADADLAIIYDGQCPFCSSYVKLLRLRSAVGRVQLVDARTHDLARLLAQRLKLDLNEGMLAVYRDRCYFGADAMNILSLLTSRAGLLNRAIAAVFRSPVLSRLLYPLLKLGRRASLLALGRTPITGEGICVDNGQNK